MHPLYHTAKSTLKATRVKIDIYKYFKSLTTHKPAKLKQSYSVSFRKFPLFSFAYTDNNSLLRQKAITNDLNYRAFSSGTKKSNRASTELDPSPLSLYSTFLIVPNSSTSWYAGLTRLTGTVTE